jgi:hypothetical protein
MPRAMAEDFVDLRKKHEIEAQVSKAYPCQFGRKVNRPFYVAVSRAQHSGLECCQYATVFAENAIDLEILPDLTDADLEKLGVALGHRKRILKAIAALSAARTPLADVPLMPKVVSANFNWPSLGP